MPPPILVLPETPTNRKERERERERERVGLHCSDTFMATAGIIHGNDGPKTDGFSGGGSGVDFVKEGEERRGWKRRGGVEKIIRGDNFRCAMGVTE